MDYDGLPQRLAAILWEDPLLVPVKAKEVMGAEIEPTYPQTSAVPNKRPVAQLGWLPTPAQSASLVRVQDDTDRISRSYSDRTLVEECSDAQTCDIPTSGHGVSAQLHSLSDASLPSVGTQSKPSGGQHATEEVEELPKPEVKAERPNGALRSTSSYARNFNGRRRRYKPPRAAQATEFRFSFKLGIRNGWELAKINEYGVLGIAGLLLAVGYFVRRT